MRVNCKNPACGKLFARVMGGRRRYCCEACCLTVNDAARHAARKLRYRNDPAFREAMKTEALRRYHHQRNASA